MFGAFLAVVYLAGVAKSLYCPGVSDRATTCFTSKGLSYHADNDEDDPGKVFFGVKLTDLKIYCSQSNIHSFNNAIACASSQARKCMDAKAAAAVPSDDSWVQFYDFLCKRKDEIHANCSDTKNEAVVACGKETIAKVLPTLHRPLSLSQAACLAVEINYDCAGKVLASCGNNTKTIAQEGINNYLVPILCGVKPGRPGRKPFTYPMSSASALSQSVTVFVISLLMSLLFHQ